MCLPRARRPYHTLHRLFREPVERDRRLGKLSQKARSKKRLTQNTTPLPSPGRAQTVALVQEVTRAWFVGKGAQGQVVRRVGGIARTMRNKDAASS